MIDRKILSTYFLYILLLGIIGTYFYFWSFLDSEYLPYYGDELFYFKNSESFFLNNNLHAAFTYNGNGSKLLGADAHGPAYPLLYGLISKLSGWHNLNILIINLGVFLSSVLLLILSKKEPLVTRIYQVILVVGSPITLFYSVTFLPELLHLAGGIFLFIFCRKYLNSLSGKDFTALLCFILVLGCFRNTWFFGLFGLIILPGQINVFKKVILAFAGFLLPFLFQHYFHEQVPNAFSDLGKLADQNWLGGAAEILFFNIKRNIYFAYTYTEGWFYTLQKIWWVCSLSLALVYFRNFKTIQFGLVTLAALILFNVVLYKNYTWVDIRLYTSLIMFLNLGMIYHSTNQIIPSILLLLNLGSFALILPLQKEMVNYRIHPDVKSIPKRISDQLTKLPSGLIYVSPELLHEYQLNQLPLENEQKKPLRYILPYYEFVLPGYDYDLILLNGQLSVPPKKILNQ